MMRSLAQRSTEPEWMDGADVTPADFAACLADLARVNTLTRARTPTLAFLTQLPADQPLTIVDVGYGHGDMLRSIYRWAAQQRRFVRLIGIDLNPRSAIAAEAATPKDMTIDFRTGDLDAISPSEPIDVVISSLVAHHMTDNELVAFLSWMEHRACRGWFINDLHRHVVAYHGFRLLSGIAGWHRFVRHDGPLSIARAFRRSDWDRLLSAAGLDRSAVSISWWLPFRLCVARLR